MPPSATSPPAACRYLSPTAEIGPGGTTTRHGSAAPPSGVLNVQRLIVSSGASSGSASTAASLASCSRDFPADGTCSAIDAEVSNTNTRFARLRRSVQDFGTT